MNPSLYFNGRQIKNYMIGFASLFSEIPYMKRNGTVGIVPIVYGSQSDVISYLESDVDNIETKNKNRLKDLTIPLFSFRLTNLQRNTDKRRAPHETITVDLRPLGYSVGYVALYPAPFDFTFELSLWASSDNQLFEILEQILPYFNSPQQVTIEPLPRCPVSRTEINLTNIEVDTDPESNKYSAMAILEFQLTGWILAQPKIWNTNMQFELQMLDMENKDVDLNKPEFDKYSFGKEIIDVNTMNPYENKKKEEIKSIENFIKYNESIKKEYLKTFKIYKKLIELGKINESTDTILNYDKVEFEIDNERIIVEGDTYDYIVDKIKDLKYLFENTKLKYKVSKNTLRDEIDVLKGIKEEKSEILKYFLILLDNEYVNKSFNKTGVEFTNSDKLKFFGTMRIDIDYILDRLSSYQSSLDWIKTEKEKVRSYLNLNKKKYYDLYFLKKFDIEKLDDKLKNKVKEIAGGSPIYREEEVFKIKSFKKLERGDKNYYQLNLIDNLAQTDRLYVIFSDKNGDILEKEIKKNILFQIEIDENELPVLKNNLVLLLYKNYQGEFQLKTMMLRLENNPYDENKFEKLKIKSAMGYQLSDEDVLGVLKNSYNLADEEGLLDTKFIETEKQLLLTMLVEKKINEGKYKTIEELKEALKDDEEYKLFEKYYNKEDKPIEKSFELLKMIDELDFVVPDKKEQDKIKKITEDGLKQEELRDKDGKLIYDVNKDGYIDKKDLEILGANVDDPEKYSFRVQKSNDLNTSPEIYYKKFDISQMTRERIKKINNSLKTIYFLMKKPTFDELKIYLELYEKGLVTESFDLPDELEKKEEIKMLGYDLNDLDDKFLFMRLFVEAIRRIMVEERDYMLYKVPVSDEELVKMLYKTEGLDINAIALGEFLKKYLSTIKDDEERLIEEIELRKKLKEDFSIYEINTELFDNFWYYIRKSEYFYEALKEKDEWLERKFPELEEKVKELLANKSN